MSADRPNFSRELTMHTLALARPIGQEDMGAALSLMPQPDSEAFVRLLIPSTNTSA